MRKLTILTTILLLFSSFGFAACPSGMVSYWTFDNETVSGSTVQDVYGSNDGSINGATVGAEGMVGEGFEFNGNSQYIEVPVGSDLNFQSSDFTIGAWVYAESYPSNYHYGIVSRWGDGSGSQGWKSYALVLHASENFLFRGSVDGFENTMGVYSASSALLNQWVFVVGTREGSNWKLYVDADLRAQDTNDFTINDNGEPLYIGSQGYTLSDDVFDGIIDEVMIFNRALNASEIELLYNQSKKGYDYCGTYKNTLPLSSKFTGFESTTNFSQVENLSAVENLTLGSPYGTISFGNNTVNAESQDYDKNVVFGDCFVAVNASGLDYTFNATAYLLMNNSDGHCGDNTIFVTSDVVGEAGAVKTGAKVCTDCKTVTIGGDTVTFRVPHFSSYAIGSNSNITIDANDPKQVNETVLFTAVYRNSSSGDFISGANCQIDVPTGSYAMNEGVDKYTYQTSFEQNGTYEYNVTCSKTGYNTLFVEDSFQILPAGEAVPEFSAIAMLLLLAITIIGIFAWRYRK